jgi:hypothetical protein
VDSRLQESVAALEFLVLVLDDLNAIDNLHEASLERFGLSGGGGGQLNGQGLSAETHPSSYDVAAIGGTATTPTALLRDVFSRL